jgi:hypothetical protein
MVKIKRGFIVMFFVLGLVSAPAGAQERTPSPYFVPYDHYMEEVNALEIEQDLVQSHDNRLNQFLGGATQFEYGIRKWWTTELYLDWQHTQNEGALFTGFRIESRFRPWVEPHKINPVFYFEYENVNDADKILKEIVGFDGREDLAVPNNVARHNKKNEIETRLILSSEIGLWNITGNFIGEKNFAAEPWEFGYALGASRVLGASGGKRCTFCASQFSAGVEMYGGLGTWHDFTLRGTSQYIGPALLWAFPTDTTIRVSPQWGLTDNSVRMLLRIGVTQDIDDFGSKIAKLFRH